MGASMCPWGGNPYKNMESPFDKLLVYTKQINMKKTLSFGIGLFMAICMVLAAIPAYAQKANPSVLKTPVYFQKNQGQWDGAIQYESNVNGTKVRLLNNKLSFYQTRVVTKPHSKNSLDNGTRLVDDSLTGSIVWNLNFLGAQDGEGIMPTDKLPTKYNYFIGNSAITDVPVYSRLKYNNIYPDIDLAYYSNNGKSLEYDVILKPGADINQVKLQYEGIDNLAISPEGMLEITTAWGKFSEHPPVSYQMVNGQKNPVEVSFVLLDHNTYGFKINDGYNPAYALVIDPLTLQWATFFEGVIPPSPGGDGCGGVVVDANGYVYMAGHTYDYSLGQSMPLSPTINNIPASLGPSLQYNSFLAKLEPDATSIDYVTIFGTCSGNTYTGDRATDIALGPGATPNIYLSGFARLESTSCPFPTVPTNTATTSQLADAYAVEFNNSGNTLINSALIGGTYDDYGNGIAVDPSGNAYLIGTTRSPDFPGLTSGFSSSGVDKAFVCKLPASGFATATYTVGFQTPGSSAGQSDGQEQGKSIAVDDAGNAYVLGMTTSTIDWSLNPFASNPATAFDIANSNYPQNVFVARISAAGSVNYSTIIGGDGYEVPCDIKLNSHSSPTKLYISGVIDESYTTAHYPTLNGFCTTNNFGFDAFVSSINIVAGGSFNTFSYSTLLGANIPSSFVGYTIASYQMGIDVASNGKIYFVTTTSSADNTEDPPLPGCVLQNDYTDYGEPVGTPSLLIGIIDPSQSGTNTLSELTYWSSATLGHDEMLAPEGPALLSDGSMVLVCGADPSTQTFPTPTNPPAGPTNPVFEPYAVPASGLSMYVMKLSPKNVHFSSPGRQICINRVGCVDLGDILTLQGATLTPDQQATLTYVWSSSPHDATLDGQENLAHPCVQPTVNTDYTVNVTVAGHCIGQGTMYIHLLPAPELQIQLGGSNPFCYGTDILLLAVDNSGNVYPNPTWSTGSTDNPLIVNQSGTYTVTVSWATNTCKSTDSRSVTELHEWSVDGTVTNATCGNNDGSITVTVMGSNPPYTYDWDDGASGQTRTNLAPGTYIVYVNDANGCQIADTFTVGGGGSSTTIDTTVCDSAHAIIYLPQTGILSASYYWTKDGLPYVPEPSTAPNLLLTQSGVYVLYYSHDGCTDTITVNATVDSCGVCSCPPGWHCCTGVWANIDHIYLLNPGDNNNVDPVIHFHLEVNYTGTPGSQIYPLIDDPILQSNGYLTNITGNTLQDGYNEFSGDLVVTGNPEGVTMLCLDLMIIDSLTGDTCHTLVCKTVPLCQLDINEQEYHCSVDSNGYTTFESTLSVFYYGHNQSSLTLTYNSGPSGMNTNSLQHGANTFVLTLVDTNPGLADTITLLVNDSLNGACEERIPINLDCKDNCGLTLDPSCTQVTCQGIDPMTNMPLYEVEFEIGYNGLPNSILNITSSQGPISGIPPNIVLPDVPYYLVTVFGQFSTNLGYMCFQLTVTDSFNNVCTLDTCFDLPITDCYPPCGLTQLYEQAGCAVDTNGVEIITYSLQLNDNSPLPPSSVTVLSNLGPSTYTSWSPTMPILNINGGIQVDRDVNPAILYILVNDPALGYCAEQITINDPCDTAGQPTQQMLMLQPNPASNNVSINYAFNGGSQKSILISDVSGHIVQRFDGVANGGKMDYNVGKMEGGIYLVTLVEDGVVLEMRRLVIAR